MQKNNVGKRALRIALMVSVILNLAYPVYAVQAITSLGAAPSSIQAGSPVTVLFTAVIPADSSLIATSPNLLRWNGSSWVVVSRMYDDGTHGDVISGDGIYSTNISLNEPTVTDTRWKANAAYRRKLTRVYSQELIVPVTGRQIIAEASGIISPGGGVVAIPGVAEVELPENLQRPALDIQMQQVVSPDDRAAIQERLVEAGFPSNCSTYIIDVTASQSPGEPVTIRVPVPDDIRASITPGSPPDLFVNVIGGSEEDDAYPIVQALGATYVEETGELVGILTDSDFSTSTTSTAAQSTGISSTVSGKASIHAAAVSVRATIVIGLNNQQTISNITGSFTQPGGTLIEARVNDTIQFDGTLTASIVSVAEPLSGTISSHFGPRNVPGGSSYHEGIDYAVPAGSIVYAAAAGRVERVGLQDPDDPEAGYGYRIYIRHPDGSQTVYAHLEEDTSLFSQGEPVSAGQAIALSGNTGSHYPPGPNAGYHLHFGYMRNGQWVDPEPYFEALPQDYLSQLKIRTTINGVAINGTTRDWGTSETTHYTSSVNLSTIGLQPGRDYPAQVIVTTNTGQAAVVYRGILAISATALRTVLTWDKYDTDVDTHVYDSLGHHAWYADLGGIPGARLDHDDTDGFGPETFSMDQMVPGVTYTVAMHYYSDHGNGPTTARMRVYQNNVLVTDRSALLFNRQWVTVGTYPVSSASALDYSAEKLFGPFYPYPTWDPYLIKIPGIPNLIFRLIPKK